MCCKLFIEVDIVNQDLTLNYIQNLIQLYCYGTLNSLTADKDTSVQVQFLQY